MTILSNCSSLKYLSASITMGVRGLEVSEYFKKEQAIGVLSLCWKEWWYHVMVVHGAARNVNHTMYLDSEYHVLPLMAGRIWSFN